MQIRCSNGHKLRAKIHLAGKSVRCPACDVVVQIPDVSAFKAETKPKQRPLTGSESLRNVKDDVAKAPATEAANFEWESEGEGDWESDWNDDSSKAEFADDPYDNSAKLPPRKLNKAKTKPAKKKVDSKKTLDRKWGPLHWAGAAGAGIVSLLLILLVIWLASGATDEPGLTVSQDNSPFFQNEVTSDASTPHDAVGSHDAVVARATGHQGLPTQDVTRVNERVSPQKETPVVADSPSPTASSSPRKNLAASRSNRRQSVVRPRGGLALVANHPVIAKIAVGQSVALRMAKGVTDVAFAVEPLADDAESEPNPNWIMPFVRSTVDSNAVRLNLSASIFGAQEVVLLDSVQAVSALPIPFKIRIGQEIMTVKGVDEFKDALRVERAAVPTSHSVTEGVFVINEDDVGKEPEEGVPTLDSGQLLWIPAAKDVGRQVVFVKGTPSHPRMAKDWAWEIEVLAPSQKKSPTRGAREDFALIESFDPIRPLPDKPEPVLTAVQKRQKSNESRSVAKQRLALLRKKSGLAARFQPMPDGIVNVSMRTLRVEANNDTELSPQTLSFGAGLRLLEEKFRWSKGDNRRVSQRLVTEVESSEYPKDAPIVRVHRLNTIVEQSDVQDRFLKMLPSANGKWLYVLTKDGHLFKLDVAKWEIAAGVVRSDGFSDMCWSSAGLVLLKSKGPRTSRDGLWSIIEPIPDARRTQPEDLLLILDPDSLEITNALAIGGSSIAGDRKRDLVYVDQSADSRIAVVNVLDGTLVNVVSHKSLIGNGETQQSMPYGSMLDDFWLVGNGSSLLCRFRSSLRSGNTSLHRFAASGANIVRGEGSGLVPVVGPFQTSADGQVVSFASKTTQLGLSFFPTANLGGSGHSIYTKFPVTHHVVDTASKTIVYAQPVTTSGMRIEGDYGKFEFNVLQAGKKTVVPLGLENIIDMVSLPGGRGILITTNKSTLWMEILSKAPQWTFERDTPSTLPIAECKIPSRVPQDPIPWSKAVSEKELKLGSNSKRVLWDPEETAFFTMSRETIHRFDAATRTETHRWAVEELESSYGRQVPGFFATSDGLVFDNGNHRTVYLLSFDDLNPIWELPTSYAYRPSGSPLHNRIAAMCKPGIVIFEAGSARVVARASFLDLWREWPVKKNDRLLTVNATSNPNLITCKRDRVMTLRIDDGRLKFDGDSP